MDAPAEAGADDAGGHRLAHQELLRALAFVVIVVDDAVVGGAEAVEALGDAAERERGEEDFGVAGVAVLASGSEWKTSSVSPGVMRAWKSTSKAKMRMSWSISGVGTCCSSAVS